MFQTSKVKFRVSPNILDHLGVAAYNSIRKCLAELCANCYDADATVVKITLPFVIDEHASIVIEDDGIGMSREDLETKYLNIGLNRRTSGQKTDKGRDIIGSKGIGKLAGFGVAGRIKIITCKNKMECSFTLHRSIFDDFDNINDCPIDILAEQTDRGNGTKIILSDINKQMSIPPKKDLREHLFKSLPALPDFRLILDDTECTAEDIEGERVVSEVDMGEMGKVSGFYIIASKRQPHFGLSVRVRKRIVAEPGLFGIEKRSHFSFAAEKIVGEVNADFLDPYINTTRDGFLEDCDAVKIFIRRMQEFVSKIISGEESQAETKRSAILLGKPDIQKKMAALPPHIRGTATKVLNAVIAKLTRVEDDETEELINWVLRYYESNVLKELINAIMAAEGKDVERLSELVQEWGVKQITSVTDLIKSQIDIISKLAELVTSEKTHEIELHKLIEKNLWLVREGLELWASDKTLKTLLDGHIEILYRGKEALRPDLICRSRDNGNQAVIIEFKRPGEIVNLSHLTQALEYASIIKRHRPNISFETYVVGRQYDSAVLAAKEQLQKAELNLWSFEEILHRARMRFEEILKILES